MLREELGLTGTKYGAVTDEAGHYAISVSPGSYTVRAQNIGYNPSHQTVQVVGGQTATANFDLNQSAVTLDEIVVTGTAAQVRKKEVGNATASISAQDIQVAPLVNSQDVLEGRAAGVTVLDGSGQPGSGGTIKIRGVNTVSQSMQPLIYVDGVRVDNDEATGPANQSFGSRSISRLSDINPSDIQSIEVIKGPAAATLYGTEAANGVIQIITKKGRQGGTRFDLQVNEGGNWFANPAGRLWTNYGMVGGVLDSINFTQLQNNWLNMQRAMGETPKNIFQTGMLQTYNASMSGGNDLTQFFVSGYYQHDVGVESVNKLRKGGGRLNVSVTPSAHWRVDGNFGYVVGRTDLACEAGCGGVTWTTYFMDPTTLSDSMRQGFFSGTPDSYHALYPEWQDLSRFTGSMQINNDPLPWFSHRLPVGLT